MVSGAERERVRLLLEAHDTVLLGVIREVGIGGQGGRLRAWFVRLDVIELLRGDPLPKPSIVFYIHSPAQEFPLHDSENLAGVQCLWAIRREGDVFRSVDQLFSLDPIENALASVRALLASK